jgi:1,2-phenylacetyl-CoA epoxidase catalytic subunit
MRYAEWCTAAPTLEADIAAAAMGLDDIGHSRVLYGCLKDLEGGDGGEEAGDGSYRNIAFLDRPWSGWPQFIAANVVLDTAFSLMIEALASGNVEVLRTRLKKMLQEERYHFLHGRSWMKEAEATQAIGEAWKEAVEWFGPEGSDVDELQRAGAVSLTVKQLRDRLRERLQRPEPRLRIEWRAWDPGRRRTTDGAIDQPTLEMIRGLAERRYMPSG